MWGDLPSAVWAAIVTAIGVALTVVAKLGPDRASAASQLTTASVALVNELQEQNAALLEQVQRLESENRKLRVEVSDLKVQVDRLQESIDRLGDTNGH